MKKRLLSLLLAVLLCAGMFPMSAAAHPFTDVRNEWYSEAVEYVYDEGIFDGVGNGLFAPGRPMTRAQFVQVLANNTSNYQKVSISSPFRDVRNSSAWYYDAVLWAYDNGLVSGTSASNFSPNSYIKREDMVTLLYRYAKRIGAPTNITSGVERGYSDYSRVSSHAREAVRWALTHQVISGSGGRIYPQNSAKRSEVAQIFYNAWNVVPPGSELKEPEATGDPREGLNMTHSQLRVNGFEDLNDGISGSWLYEYYLYPNAIFLMPLDYEFSNSSKPHAIITFFDEFWPELAGKSVTTVKNALPGLSVEYNPDNPFLGSRSGYYGYYDDGTYYYMILLDQSGAFSADDLVVTSLSTGQGNGGGTVEPTTDAYAAALGKSYNTLVQEYGTATLVKSIYEYGYYSYYSFRDLPDAVYRFYTGSNSSSEYPVGIYPPMSFTGPISRLVPEIENLLITQYEYYTYYTIGGGEFYYYWSNYSNGYHFSYVKHGVEYGGFASGQEERLPGSLEVVAQTYGHS